MVVEKPSFDILTRINEFTQDWGVFWNNLPLEPKSLAKKIPRYSEFSQSDLDPLIFVKPEALANIVPGQRILFAVLGPSSTGKDSTLALALVDYSDIATIKTSTTRKRRNDEDSNAYDFRSMESFTEILAAGKFIETLPQGSDVYGTTEKSVRKALDDKSSPIAVWRGDLNGLPKIKAWVEDNYNITVISIIILPEMPILNLIWRIIEKRGPFQAFSWRISKAFWEIRTAPELADIFVRNPPEESGQPTQAAGALKKIFQLVGTGNK